MKPGEKTYIEIAKKFGVAVDEVKREMQRAVQDAFIFPSYEAESIPRKGEIPTVSEFIEYAADRIGEETPEEM